MDVIDILLNNDPVKAEEKDYKIKRLSKAYKEDVIFKLRGLGYSRVAEIKNMNSEDVSVHIVLAGVKEPNFKNKDLLEKYNAPNPAELIKKMLLPGEIEDISKAIELLSGYRKNTIEEDFETNLMYFLFVEKNIMPTQYYNMSEGEKEVIRAFFLHLINERKEYLENLENLRRR